MRVELSHCCPAVFPALRHGSTPELYGFPLKTWLSEREILRKCQLVPWQVTMHALKKDDRIAHFMHHKPLTLLSMLKNSKDALSDLHQNLQLLIAKTCTGY
jgi:hypothetical protein